MSRKELRASALNDVLRMGEQARASQPVPDVYSITQRLGLPSQSMAERLRNTRRLHKRLSFLVPPYEAPPPPPEVEDTGSSMPGLPSGADNRFAAEAEEQAAHPMAGDMMMLVAAKIAAAIECLNLGSLLGKDELRGLAREFGETAMRFGLKFRSAVPIWMLEEVRGGDVRAMQVAATALLVWSEIEGQAFTDDLRQALASLHPVPVQTLDDSQDTVELVRLALTASRN